MKEKRRYDALGIAIILSLIVLDLFIWHDIFLYGTIASGGPRAYVLDLGKNMATFMALPGNIKVLTDAGSDQTAVAQLEKILPVDDTYIDLGIISDALPEHFDGYNYLLDHYRFGAIAYNGRSAMSDTNDWAALLQKIKAQNIPLITIGAGDIVHSGGGEIDILSPDSQFAQSAALADTALVQKVSVQDFTALVTADTGQNVRNILQTHGDDLRAQLLISSGTAYTSVAQPEFALTGTPTATLEVIINNGKPQIMLYNR
jgi:beta-lactamase superfamily II metal-dependent hydrolase